MVSTRSRAKQEQLADRKPQNLATARSNEGPRVSQPSSSTHRPPRLTLAARNTRGRKERDVAKKSLVVVLKLPSHTLMNLKARPAVEESGSSAREAGSSIRNRCSPEDISNSQPLESHRRRNLSKLPTPHLASDSLDSSENTPTSTQEPTLMPSPTLGSASTFAADSNLPEPGHQQKEQEMQQEQLTNATVSTPANSSRRPAKKRKSSIDYPRSTPRKRSRKSDGKTPRLEDHETPALPSAIDQSPILRDMAIDDEFLLSVPHNDDLRTTASNLKAANTHSQQDQKPEPSGQPPIWAERRSDLCETVPYFRSFQSGIHTVECTVNGFLFSNNHFGRDFMDATTTISRAGGGMTQDADGNWTEDKAKDQGKKCVKFLENNIKNRIPVVHITDRKNPCIPSRSPHQYSVLGYYKPTDIWHEKKWHNGEQVTFPRFRFERRGSPDEIPWVHPKETEKESHEFTKLGSLAPPVYHICPSCNKSSPQVYLNGWMCLRPDCRAFWKLKKISGELSDPDESMLIYDPRFLKKKTTWDTDNHHLSLMPMGSQFNDDSSAEALCMQSAWKGIVCPKCRRCIPRLFYKGWICKTIGCDYERIIPRKAIAAASLRDPYFPLRDSYSPCRNRIEKDIIAGKPIFAYNYRIQQYRIPGAKGVIFHFIANETVVTEAGGPDDMFEEIQLKEIGLQRRIVGSEKSKVAFYSRHMNVNYGMPYKFVAAGITGFNQIEDANAKCIPNARSRLSWARYIASRVVEDKSNEGFAQELNDKEFNELLALAYFEDQRIDFHDDGEVGLGPTIATLSLGATGKFLMRMKKEYYYGLTAGKNGHLIEDRPLPGCVKYEERLAAYNEFSQATSAAERQELVKKKKRVLNLKYLSGEAKPVIELRLGHGDIVIMHGSDLQEYFEHSVSHKGGLLRFAATCRFINPNSVDKKLRPQEEMKPDTVKYDGTKLPLPLGIDGKPIGDVLGVKN